MSIKSWLEAVLQATCRLFLSRKPQLGRDPRQQVLHIINQVKLHCLILFKNFLDLPQPSPGCKCSISTRSNSIFDPVQELARSPSPLSRARSHVLPNSSSLPIPTTQVFYSSPSPQPSQHIPLPPNLSNLNLPTPHQISQMH